MQHTWVWHKPSWRREPLAPPQNYQNLQRTEETGSWRAQTELCTWGPRRKEQWPQETGPGLPVSVQESPAEAWVGSGLVQGRGHGIQSHHFMANRWGNNGNIDFIFWGPKLTADGDCSHEIKRCLLLGRKAMTNLDSILKSRDITSPTKVCLSQSYGFSNSHVWMWELDHKEIWVPQNWCFWTVVLEKILESPLDCREIQPVNPKGNQSWIFIGKTDTEAPILWLPNEKNWFIGKDPDAGKDWNWEEKGATEDEMVGWHHWLDGHELEQAPGVADGQESLVCCSPWGHRVGQD